MISPAGQRIEGPRHPEYDGSVLDIPSRRELHRLPAYSLGDPDPVMSCDGTYFVIPRSHRWEVWDLGTAACIKRVRTPYDSHLGIALSTDLQAAALGYSFRTEHTSLMLWSVLDGTVRRTVDVPVQEMPHHLGTRLFLAPNADALVLRTDCGNKREVVLACDTRSGMWSRLYGRFNKIGAGVACDWNRRRACITVGHTLQIHSIPDGRRLRSRWSLRTLPSSLPPVTAGTGLVITANASGASAWNI